MGKAWLSVPQISKLCGYSRAWGATKARGNEIPAKRVPGYEQARYYKSARLLKWCDEQRRLKEKEKMASRAPRVRVSQRRAQQIKK
jgi:hypothetical protein